MASVEFISELVIHTTTVQRQVITGLILIRCGSEVVDFIRCQIWVQTDFAQDIPFQNSCGLVLVFVVRMGLLVFRTLGGFLGVAAPVERARSVGVER